MKFRKRGSTEMRPYVNGEPLDGVSVGASDKVLLATKDPGGMIATGDNPSDQWYISQQYFGDHYEPAAEERSIVTARTTGPGAPVILETEHTAVYVMDRPVPRAGNACHLYRVRGDGLDLLDVNFQRGPIKEAGVNGVQHIDLLAIVKHRLEDFQRGPFKSDLNATALQHVNRAILADKARTNLRANAGAEGTSRTAAEVDAVEKLGWDPENASA